MTEIVDREAVLGAFDRDREQFEAALRRAPDAALRFKPEGEDYALGGLVIHVSDVLRRYTQVLDALRQADFAPLQAPRHITPDEDSALIRNGFNGEARGAIVEDLRSAH